MRTTYDLTKAQAVVNEYAAAISDTSQPAHRGRSWLEFCMVRNGLIPSVRNLAFGETQALWFACLIVTKQVRRISRLEVAMRYATKPRTTERTIKRVLSTRYSMERDSHIGRLVREILAAYEKRGAL